MVRIHTRALPLFDLIVEYAQRSKCKENVSVSQITFYSSGCVWNVLVSECKTEELWSVLFSLDTTTVKNRGFIYNRSTTKQRDSRESDLRQTNRRENEQESFDQQHQVNGSTKQANHTLIKCKIFLQKIKNKACGKGRNNILQPYGLR